MKLSPVYLPAHIYKILTAALTNRIYNHLLRKNILPEEQKGCHRKSRRCKDQMLVSKMIKSLVKKHQKHLYMAWADYKKTFDNLRHTWIITVMKIYRICPTVRRFVEALKKEWKTKIWHYYIKGHIKTGKVAFNGEYSKVTPCFHYYFV
jgi:hypothetical protein